ncbi:thiazole biosynthesis adenylyltransferase ThiF, partial [bacterium]|nr:thiazole biosynthesis adenylyltransferase ThiF [bacterium]
VLAPACVRNEFGFLEGRAASRATALCGRDAVQVLPADGAAWDLDTLAARLANVGEVKRRGIYLEARVEDFTLLVFPDARVIVRGTGDEGRARSVVARFLGA